MLAPLLDSELVRTFVTIAETGSFSRAAEVVHRTPSAISMQIKRLEEQLGRTLFERQARHVVLTADGEALLGYARRLLAVNAEAVARFLQPALTGHVFIGAPDDFGMRFVPNILARFASTHPDVDVDVVLAPSMTLSERLAAGGLDIAMLTVEPQKPVDASSQVVFSEPLVWVGVKGGCAFERPKLPLALAANGCAWRTIALQALDRVDRPYRIAYTSEHGFGQLAAVLADLAIAPLPASLLDSRFERLDGMHDLPSMGHYQIIVRRGVEPSALSDALADHVIASFRDVVPGQTAPHDKHVERRRAVALR